MRTQVPNANREASDISMGTGPAPPSSCCKKDEFYGWAAQPLRTFTRELTPTHICPACPALLPLSWMAPKTWMASHVASWEGIHSELDPAGHAALHWVSSDMPFQDLSRPALPCTYPSQVAPMETTRQLRLDRAKSLILRKLSPISQPWAPTLGSLLEHDAWQHTLQPPSNF